jgi:hypothetical protein
MPRIPRYGDEETIVSSGEKVVALLYIAGIALLLAWSGSGAEDPAGTNARANTAVPAQPREATTGRRDRSASTARKQVAAAPRQ